MILFYSVFGFLLFIYGILLLLIIIYLNYDYLIRLFRFDKGQRIRDNGIIPNKDRG